ncbi:MAG TPA: hypothetical protein VMU81_14595 [Acetobacteraceae bacterium]|nr:hypothetical protein [Acetobacteraceae bacterium]
MRESLIVLTLTGLLTLGACTVPSTEQQSNGPMINNQGERVVVIKNPPSKSDAQYANEMASCESFSRMHIDDKVNAYSGCMLYFGNLAQVGGHIFDKASLTPRSATTPFAAGEAAAGPTPNVISEQPPPVAPVSRNFAAETWHCTEGMTVDIDRGQRRVEMNLPSLSCDILVVDGVTGPLGGQCPFVSGNPLLQYKQFARFTSHTITWGYEAAGPGAIHLQLSDAAYAKYTLNTLGARGHLEGVTGQGGLASGSCSK